MQLRVQPVAQVEIISERARTGSGGGWEFVAAVLDEQGQLRHHTVTLSWADYNLWSADGADEPSKVIEAVIEFLLTRVRPADMRVKFDASTLRRLFADADEAIPAFIRR
jgi:hypothetical protein